MVTGLHTGWMFDSSRSIFRTRSHKSLISGSGRCLHSRSCVIHLSGSKTGISGWEKLQENACELCFYHALSIAGISGLYAFPGRGWDEGDVEVADEAVKDACRLRRARQQRRHSFSSSTIHRLARSPRGVSIFRWRSFESNGFIGELVATKAQSWCFASSLPSLFSVCCRSPTACTPPRQVSWTGISLSLAFPLPSLTRFHQLFIDMELGGKGNQLEASS